MKILANEGSHKHCLIDRKTMTEKQSAINLFSIKLINTQMQF